LSAISNGQISLLNVVKALGEYLTAEEDELRKKGNFLNHSHRVRLDIKWQVSNFFLWSWNSVPQTRSTASLVQTIVISLLFRGFTAIAIDAARVLVTFYCGKLDDTETIMPALKGLATLASLPTCTSSDVEDIIRA
jgi:DNA repair/transcription protein MET18/MMS19